MEMRLPSARTSNCPRSWIWSMIFLLVNWHEIAKQTDCRCSDEVWHCPAPLLYSWGVAFPSPDKAHISETLNRRLSATIRTVCDPFGGLTISYFEEKI